MHAVTSVCYFASSYGGLRDVIERRQLPLLTGDVPMLQISQWLHPVPEDITWDAHPVALGIPTGTCRKLIPLSHTTSNSRSSHDSNIGRIHSPSDALLSFRLPLLPLATLAFL